MGRLSHVSNLTVSNVNKEEQDMLIYYLTNVEKINEEVVDGWGKRSVSISPASKLIPS